MNIPSGWTKCSLEMAAILQRGFDLPVQDRKPGEVPVVASNGPVGTHSEAPVKGPGVVTGRSGTIGKVFYCPNDFWPLNTTLYVKDFHGNDPRFVALLLESLRLERFSESTGVPSLNRNTVHPVPVLVPPLHEQRKIAAILSSVDDTIEKTEAVIDQLEVVKEGLLGQIFSLGLDPSASTKKHPELGAFPEHWEARRLDALVASGTSITYGIVQAGPEVPGGVPYIRTGDVSEEGIDVETLRRTASEIAAKFKRSKVRTGDLVYCIRASVGAVVKVGPTVEGANLTQGTARIAPGPDVDADFLLWALRSPPVRSWVDQQCKGSTFREITLAKLRETPIPVAPRAEQERIATLLGSIAHRVGCEKRALAASRAFKSALLDALLSGRVRVTTPAREVA